MHQFVHMAGTVQEEVDGHIGVDTILGVVNDKAHFHANCALIKPGLARILGSAPFAAASRHIPHGMCVVAAILHVTELLLQLFKAVQVWKEMLNFRKTSKVLRVRRLRVQQLLASWCNGSNVKSGTCLADSTLARISMEGPQMNQARKD